MNPNPNLLGTQSESVDPSTIWTVGHSSRPIEEFLRILQSASIEMVADVRRFPGSRRQPQYGQDALQRALLGASIDYRHFLDLGGRRRDRLDDSPNGGWRVESFNAYADYMLTPTFQKGLGELEAVAASAPTVIMCAEAVPWRCHRRLIADALLVRGWRVLDIFSVGRTTPHKLTEFAQLDNQQVVYPRQRSNDDPE